MRTLAFALAMLLHLTPAAARADAPPDVAFDLGPSIAFADARSAARFGRYLAFLLEDPVKHRQEIETVRRLGLSEVTYVIVLKRRLPPETGGLLTTDGEAVFVNVLDEERRDSSLNSRLAHELEHARQFDAGELGFARDPETGAWRPMMATYDIGDEVLAWEAQLRVATAADLWTRDGGRVEPTVLMVLANASSFEERARLLRTYGYKNRNATPYLNVAFVPELGHAAGELVRTKGRLFARVHPSGARSFGRGSATASAGEGAASADSSAAFRWAPHASGDRDTQLDIGH